MLHKEYFPPKNKNKLKNVGGVAAARDFYYKNKPTNLIFLLKKRYGWMNKFIQMGDKVLEVGSGTGISKDFIRKDAQVILSDIEKYPWIDKKIDALDTKYPDNSFDIIFCSNMIHHVAFPKKFFGEMQRIIKPSGHLLIQEVNCSLMCRFMLRILCHEGWSFKRNPFHLNESCNDKNDFWSGNNAIPNLLFDNSRKFEQNIPFFKIKHQKFSEFFIFPFSGGVTAKFKTINFSFKILKIIDKLDRFLVYLAPKIFAMQRRIVLTKKE